MGDIIIPEARLEAFLRSLLVRVTKVQQDLIAETVADVEVFRAQMNAGYECKVREAEEKIELMIRAVEEKMRAAEEEVERKLRAAEDQIACKRREAEDEIARLRQLERLRQTAVIEPQ